MSHSKNLLRSLSSRHSNSLVNPCSSRRVHRYQRSEQQRAPRSPPHRLQLGRNNRKLRPKPSLPGCRAPHGSSSRFGEAAGWCLWRCNLYPVTQPPGTHVRCPREGQRTQHCAQTGFPQVRFLHAPRHPLSSVLSIGNLAVGFWKFQSILWVTCQSPPLQKGIWNSFYSALEM